MISTVRTGTSSPDSAETATGIALLGILTINRSPAMRVAAVAAAVAVGGSPSSSLKKASRRRRATEACTSWPTRSPKNMRGNRITVMSESVGNATCADMARSGETHAIATSATRVAICGSTIVIVIWAEKM